MLAQRQILRGQQRGTEGDGGFRVFGQQRARKQCQRRILRAADRNVAFEAGAALDPDTVHRRALAAGDDGANGDGQAFSSVHCNGCWFSRAKSITWLTLVSATS